MRSIYLMAGPKDYELLLEFIRDIGMKVLPLDLTLLDESGNHPMERAPCREMQMVYLSPLPVSELHPYGDPPVQISSVTDPMLEFVRPYYDPENNALVQGDIRWEGKGTGLRLGRDVGTPVQPYFNKLSRWIKKNWVRRKDIGSGSWWFGPEAERLVDQHGVKPMSLPPGSTIQKVWVHPETGQSYVIDEVDPETGDW